LFPFEFIVLSPESPDWLPGLVVGLFDQRRDDVTEALKVFYFAICAKKCSIIKINMIV